MLAHPRLIAGVLLAVTLVLGFWATRIETDQRAGSFISEDSETYLNLERAGQVFGKSQNLLYVTFAGVAPTDSLFLRALDAVTQEIEGYAGVDRVLSLTNAPVLVRSDQRLEPRPLYDAALPAAEQRARIESQPLLRGLLLSQDASAAVMIVQIDPEVNNSPARVELVDRIDAAVHGMPGDAALAGPPYLWSQYAKRIGAEMPLFTALALLISLLFLFLTFRSWRSVLMPTLIVGLGLLWTIGLIALFGHKMNIVTAVLPALVVIIGMANSIHLISKFFDRYRLMQDRRAAMLDTIRTVGLATFLTALTTAVGFGVLIFSGSRVLEVFGLFAAVGILLLYALSITIVPLAYTKLPPPKTLHASLATHDGLTDFFDHVARFTKRRGNLILVGAVLIVAGSVYGATLVSSDVFVFTDFSEDDPLRQDLAVFEAQVGGALPLEVVVAAESEGQMRDLRTIRQLDRLEQAVVAHPEVGRALSASDLLKVARQAYFGGQPAAYRLPSSYEMPFLQAPLTQLLDRDSTSSLVASLPRMVDSTFTMARIYAGVSDVGTKRMNALVDSIEAEAAVLFPDDRFDVFVTGAAVLTTRTGENLVRNLMASLGVALLIISALMAWLFRSLRLTLISLVPNVVPLLFVAGTMGLSGILLKPSTALIFSLAFGIAVDDTIHFLAKYRLLRQAGLTLDDAVRTTLRETGKAILFTSLVLMSGFLVFTLSGFGGTVNLGALTALTLGVALVANLLLLPALLYRFGPRETAAAVASEGALAATPEH